MFRKFDLTMNKRAEEAALEAYPVNMTPLVYQDLIDQFGGKTEIDVNTYPRCLFQEGYELAEKDTIDYACYELEFRLPEYLNYNGVQVERAEFIKDFRKAMKE